MAETLESDKCVVLSRSGSLEPEMGDWGPTVKEKDREVVVAVNEAEVGEEGGARAEIDTSAPFESVKEAVSRFGGLGFWKPNNQQHDNKGDVKRRDTFLTSELASHCTVVLCCRAAPLQKAGVVALMKNRTDDMTLAIGDGQYHSSPSRFFVSCFIIKLQTTTMEVIFNVVLCFL